VIRAVRANTPGSSSAACRAKPAAIPPAEPAVAPNQAPITMKGAGLENPVIFIHHRRREMIAAPRRQRWRIFFEKSAEFADLERQSVPKLCSSTGNLLADSPPRQTHIWPATASSGIDFGGILGDLHGGRSRRNVPPGRIIE